MGGKSSKKSNSAEPLPEKTDVVSTGGLSLLSASVFIVGEMAGSGILALPAAVAGTGWIGIFIITFCCLTAGCSAVFLGKCWLIVEERFPEYQTGTRGPFSVIGLKAVGPKTSSFVTLNIIVQLFGVSVVFLLISSELVLAVLKSYSTFSQIELCDWIIILGLVLIPFMWLGSPQDFSPIAFGAMACTAISCVLIAILFNEVANEGNLPPAETEVVNKSAKSVFLSLGTIIFAYGGAATFPTFQNDMKEKSKFPAAVAFGFLMLLVLYLPVAFGGYALYGKDVAPNVLTNFSHGKLITLIDILMAFHVLCAFLIVVNPVSLTFEDYFQLPHAFTWKRAGLRSLIGLLVMFTGLSVPKFGKILNLVGGSTIALTTFILPPIFYICLSNQKQADWPERRVSIFTKLVLVVIALIGLIGGIASTYSSLVDLFDPEAFTKPCYSKLFECCGAANGTNVL